MKLPEKDMLRPEEVAEYFQVSNRTVYSWCENGHVVFIKIEKTIRIPRVAIVEMIQASIRNDDCQIGLTQKQLSNLNKDRIMQIL